LCPVAIRPRHFVTEVEPEQSSQLGDRLLSRWAQLGALLDKNVHVGGRHARSGAVLFAALGVLWVIPLVLNVVFPWFRRLLTRLRGGVSGGARLAMEHAPTISPPQGEQAGFSIDEMVEVVFSQLAPLGIQTRFAPLVLVLGHGSAGLNNPHQSAYDCGACGGGHGGPNARAFAHMANDIAVRRGLEQRGLVISSETRFVGGERNTTNNDVTIFDEVLVPASHRDELERVKASLDEARRRESHERCRRFESAPLWLSPRASLLHVQARGEDLAQPRPECGHATNAACFVGRRNSTRGLFLDRRVFLVSYDFSMDRAGELLEKLLAAVVPVVAGISLEYWFSYVDRAGYGAGTKLPHNITALVGVMDGAESDLRTGLPWQMVEIHEPVRLPIVIEAELAVVQRLVRESETLKCLVDHQWIFLAALDPISAELFELDGAAAKRYTPEHPLQRTARDSRAHYEGRRGHLPFVAVEPSTEDAA